MDKPDANDAPPKRALIADIAATVGCSTATVSRVINRNGAVSPVKRKAIHQAMQRLGYRPPAPKTAPIGEMVEFVLHWHNRIEPVFARVPGNAAIDEVDYASPTSPELMDIQRSERSLSNNFHNRIFDGVSREAFRVGMKTVFSPRFDLEDEAFLAELANRSGAGLILTGNYSPLVAEIARRPHAPVVTVFMEKAGFPAITVDNHGSVALAFRHLWELGHRRIGQVAGPPESSQSYMERHQAFRTQASLAGMSVREDWVNARDSYMTDVQRWTEALLRRKDRPSALLCCNDFSAFAVMKAAAAVGLSVPGDLSVVGHDDIELASFLRVGITTLRSPLAEMGRAAVQQLILQRTLRAPPAHPDDIPALSLPERELSYQVRFATELVVRDSTAPFRAAR